ncbi:MAG: alpha/beta fold hydrolase [Planctomycetes bacterium]|nr:alpha/beta fold hydrolase [Planctomycetota bacterium]
MSRLAIAFSLLLGLAIASNAQEVPAPYKLPDNAAFTEEDVNINVTADAPDKAWAIAGTLNIPKGDKPEAGWPAVLYISGSGSQDRHGFQGALDLGTWQILDAIANAGFVVLRTDDRGLGKTPLGAPGTKPEDLGYDDLVSDARHGLKYLQGRAEVNKKKIFIVGHSEGGLTAPILASEDSSVAGVVCLAAMGRNLYDVTFEQVQDSIAKQPKAAQDQTLKVQKEFQDAVKEGREPDFNILGPLAAAQLKANWKQVVPIKKWWREHFLKDVPAIHAKLTCPVLVLQGEADFQVKPDKDARQIIRNLMAGPCKAATLKVYADLDHLFKPCGGRKSEMKLYFEKRDVDPRVIKDLTGWLKGVAAE